MRSWRSASTSSSASRGCSTSATSPSTASAPTRMPCSRRVTTASTGRPKRRFPSPSRAPHFVNNSRTGRAWRALREDPLAAEAMSMPVNKLKLLAFVFGAGTAGLCGTIFAAIQTGTVAGNFDVSLLITIYAIVILGGMGSIAGVIIGAIVINVSFQFLAPSNDHPELKRWLFYGALLLLVTRIRPWTRALFVLAGNVGVGFGGHEVVSSFA